MKVKSRHLIPGGCTAEDEKRIGVMEVAVAYGFAIGAIKAVSPHSRIGKHFSV